MKAKSTVNGKWILSVLVLASLNTACPSKKSSNGPVVPSGQAVCTAGQLFVPQYNGCFSTQGCQPGSSTAWVPQAGQCVPGTAGGVPALPGSQTSNRPSQVAIWEGQVQISDYSVLSSLLESWNICDSGISIAIWGIYGFNCEVNGSYSAALRFEMQKYQGTSLQIPGSLGRVTILAFNQWGLGRSLDYPLPPFAEFVNPGRDGKTFEVLSRGAAGTYGFNDLILAVGDTAQVLNADGTVKTEFNMSLSFNKNNKGMKSLGLARLRYVFGY